MKYNNLTSEELRMLAQPTSFQVRVKVIETLVGLRELHCHTHPGIECKCVFGLSRKSAAKNVWDGDATGCPEMLLLAKLLLRLSDEEYEEILSREVLLDPTEDKE